MSAATTGRGPRWTGQILVLVIGTFLSVLDVTIVNVAIPRIQSDFGVGSTADIQWITTAYTLTVGVLVPASGWLADRFGGKRVYVAALLGFAATSVLCGLAWDLPSMVAFRVLQAVPGGVLPVVTLAMVYKIVPAEEIGAALGTFGLGVVLAPALGPTLGGYLAGTANWRLIFFLNAPIALAGAWLAHRTLREQRDGTAHRFDVRGFVTIAVALAGLLLAFTKAPDWGWSSYPVLGLLMLSTVSLAVFVVVELDAEHPLLDVRLFLRWPFVNALLLLAVLSVGMFAVLFYIPLFLQQVQGITPLHAGWIMLPEALVMGVLSPMSGVLYDRIGPRWPVAIGLAVAALSTYLMSGITLGTPEQLIMRWTCLRGIGNAMAMMAIIAAGLAAAPRSKTNEASAINNTAQRIASALGLALLVAMVSNSQAQLASDRAGLVTLGTAGGASDLQGVALRLIQQSTTTAYANMFLLIAGITAAGAVLALWLPSRGFLRPVPRRPATPDPADTPAQPAST
jgi:EmrB/QacA subfamily drug resistance transporter